MTDDTPSGMIAKAAAAGPAPTAPEAAAQADLPANDAAPHIEEPLPPEPVDDLDRIIAHHSGGPPTAVLVIASRLKHLEASVPAMAQAAVEFHAKLSELQKQVIWLSQQRAIGEMQLERHTRATALDLAIKSLPEAAKGGASASDIIVDTAAAFLGWLKGSAS